MMEWFSEVFDVTLLATIGLIFAATMVGAYLRSKRRDPCLCSFEGFHVTLEMNSGKIVWGIMELEPTGLELRYRDTVQDENHIESSYTFYGDEFANIQALYRYADDLTDQNRQNRQVDIQRSFHPGPLRRLRRGIRRFISVAAESINEVIGVIVGRLRKPAGRYITETGESQLKDLGSSVIGHVGYAHDPLLERFIGQRVVVELLEAEDEVHEHVGILKNYSRDFLEILDVQFPQRQALTIGADRDREDACVTARVEEGVMHVTNKLKQPVLLHSLMLEDAEQMLNVVINGGETVDLHPEKGFAKAELNVRVVRELDMIVPRTRCVVRHRAEYYQPELLPDIIFDLGLVLTGHSKTEARERRLRQQLEKMPHSAMIAANLGAVLMQCERFDEAEELLEKAMRVKYSLPDNGRRTQMLLSELQRRRPKSPRPADARNQRESDVPRSM